MTTQISSAERIRRLPWLLGAETLSMFFVMLTFSGTVFVFFLDELGLDTAEIGFLLALVPMAGIIAPFIAPVVGRFGYKRTFVTFWGIRKFVMALLLLTPVALNRYGSRGAFLWVSTILLVFALCRAVAETGGYPWKKEAVPDAIRGKYSALNNMSTTIASILVAGVAGYVIDTYAGLTPFMVLIAIGIVLGLLSIVAFSRVPAENAEQRQQINANPLREMRHILQNKNFVLFLLVLGLETIGIGAVISFIPLYMKDQIGLSEGIVILLSVGTYIGALLTSFLWGWTADRYGSKPVMQFSLLLTLVLPIAWFLLPANSPASASLAMAVAVVAGVATLSWQISWTRYLFVNAIPAANKAVYLAVFYAWFAIVAGFGPILAGQLLTLSAGLEGQIGRFSINAYTPLFIMSLVLVLTGSFVVTRLQTEGRDSFRHFAGMFLRGNPIKAMRFLIQYNFSGDEMTRVVATEQMGDAHSLLSSMELIEALSDPSFHVRHEAIHSIGRMPAQHDLLEALVAVLTDPESELNITAARALGRMGDQRAIPALRETLHAGYRPLEANSARALALLGGEESAPRFMEKLAEEPNPRLRLAYVSALGHLRVKEALEQLFELLYETQSEVSRGEIGLAIARICGDEKYYLQHWRSLRSDFATSTAQAILDFEKGCKRCGMAEFESILKTTARDFAENNFSSAVNSLREMLSMIPIDSLDEPVSTVIKNCIEGLENLEDGRLDFVLLSLFAIDLAFKQMECV
jgi:HEAT repeat protein/MFS-type transporter involved in bile tolerance (Atg22 family)